MSKGLLFHPAIWQRIKDVVGRESVEREFRFLEGGETVNINVLYNKDGYLLIGSEEHDWYAIQLPDKQWRRAYTGHSNEYSRRVLEDKHGYRRVLDTGDYGFGFDVSIYAGDRLD